MVNSVVYVGSIDGKVYALDAGDGSLKWQYNTGGSVASSLTVSDGLVYVGSYNNKIYAINARVRHGAMEFCDRRHGNYSSSPCGWRGLCWFY